MNTSLLKQRVEPRPEARRRARFTLLVDGRVKGIWEKKAHQPKLILYKRNACRAKQTTVLPAWLKRKPVLMIAGLAMCAMVIGVIVVLVWLPVKMFPLALPEENKADEQAFRGVLFTEGDESASAVNTPLVVINLKLDSYRVKAGETLSDIAKKTGLDLDTLISFNNIKDARLINKGMLLAIPNKRGLRYTVRPGDSLSKLARYFRVGLNDLLDWNNLASSVIKSGQVLFIPGGRLPVNEVNRVLGKLFIWPTRGTLSSYFGMRISPITGTELFHNGIDIANEPLTSVSAAMAGRVGMVGYDQRYGNYVIVMHDDGFQTLYGHLQTVSVRKGQYVAQGEKLGGMGNTGASTGYHLHFSIFKNGRETDPLKYLQ